MLPVVPSNISGVNERDDRRPRPWGKGISPQDTGFMQVLNPKKVYFGGGGFSVT